MKNVIINFIGYFLDKLQKIFCIYKSNNIYRSLGLFSKYSNISYPFDIQGASNIYIGEHVNIRHHSTITAINAKVIIKKWTGAAPYLYISTGNHKMIPGRYYRSITDKEKGLGYDKDVIINEDVWISSRVTILMGVNVGRGAIIAAGAIVNKNVLPYSIVGGVPAKFIKFKWTLEQVLEHERILYPEHERFSKEQLKSFGLQ